MPESGYGERNISISKITILIAAIGVIWICPSETVVYHLSLSKNFHVLSVIINNII